MTPVTHRGCIECGKDVPPHLDFCGEQCRHKWMDRTAEERAQLTYLLRLIDRGTITLDG